MDANEENSMQGVIPSELLESLSELTEHQHKAVLSDTTHTIIAAVPGSGKTKVIVQRALYLILSGTCKRLAIITFTRAAADEIRERFQNFGVGKSQIIIGTFHALCVKLLRNSGVSVDLDALIGELKLDQYLHLALEASSSEMTFTNAKKVLGRFGSDPHGYYTEAERALIDSFYSTLRRHGLSDFASLIRDVVDGFASRRIALLPIEHMLVDEAQDIDMVQLEFIEHHMRAGIATTLVGDDDQSIYGFKFGLGYQAFVRYQTIAGKPKVVSLEHNFRSHAEITNHALALIRHNNHRFEKKLHSVRGPGGSVLASVFLNELEESQQACLYVTDLTKRSQCASSILAKSEGQSTVSIAILARRNRDLDRIECGLLQRGVIYYREKKESIWDKPIAGFFVGILESLVHPQPVNAIEKALVLLTPLRTIFADLAGEEIHQNPDPQNFFIWFSDRVRTVASASPSGSGDSNIQISLQRFPALWADWKLMVNNNPATVIREIARWVKPIIDKSQHGLLNTLQDMLQKRRGKLTTRLNLSGMHKHQPMPGVVQLRTIHASKGMQFDHVVIVGANEPETNDDSVDEAEERRIMYVGITRARDNLVITSHRKRPVSRFLTETEIPLERKKTLTYRQRRHRTSVR